MSKRTHRQKAPEKESISSVILGLRNQGVLLAGAADGLLQLIDMGDRVAGGADVDRETLEAIKGEQSYRLLYALATIASVQEARRTVDASLPNEMGWVRELLNGAWTDSAGRVVVTRVNTRAKGHVWLPVGRDRRILTAWVPETGDVPLEAARDDDGRVAMAIAALAQGTIPMPLDNDGVPLFDVVAVVAATSMAMESSTGGPPTWTIPVEQVAQEQQ